MSNTITQLKIGTRPSKLALKQTELVLEKLNNLPQIKKKFTFKIIKVKTKGDIDKSKILDSGYKGFFTKKIDDLLLKKKIDLAVHSAKDIPSRIDNNISIAAFLKREDPRDILLTNKNYTFDTLPQNLTIGTSSIRRKTQIHNIRPDLKIEYMRGNVETRITGGAIFNNHWAGIQGWSWCHVVRTISFLRQRNPGVQSAVPRLVPGYRYRRSGSQNC